MRRENSEADARDAERGANGELPDVAAETTLLRGRKRASWGTQFRILSGRAFKNLYRDPYLLAAHYLSAIGLAREWLSVSVTTSRMLTSLQSFVVSSSTT